MSALPMDAQDKNSQIYQPNGPLDQLAYNFANQPAQPQNYGSYDGMGVNVTPPDKGIVMGNYLHNIGMQHIQGQQQQKDQQFLKSIHDVMASNSTREDKIQHLIDLNTQHGGGHLDDTIKQLGDLEKSAGGTNIYVNDPTTGTLKQTGIVPKGSKVVNTPAGVINSNLKEQDAAPIADAIISGQQPPDLTGMYGLAPKVRKAMAEKGFDLTKASTDWTATKTYVKNLNSTQQVRLNQALDSVNQGIDPLRQLSGEFERTNFQPANYLIQGAKLNGVGLDPAKAKKLNQSQMQVAAKYVTQLNLMRDELAQSFSGGYAPTESAFKLADGVLNPLYGDTPLNASLDQVKFNLGVRKSAITGGSPMGLTGPVQQPQAPQNLNQLVTQGGQPQQSQGQASRQLDRNTAMQILQQAGGDKNKARQIAQQQGFVF